MAFGRQSRAAKTREPLDEAALYAYAVRSLGRKMRTIAELKKLMSRRVEPGESGHAKIDSVIRRLVESQYLNDTRYAADYTRLRQENQRFGRRRVQQELTQRGVHGDIVGQTLDAAYADIPEPELARRYLERKRLRKPMNEKETARIVRSMVRAGFSTGTIFPLLKAWDVEQDVLASIESLDEAPEAE